MTLTQTISELEVTNASLKETISELEVANTSLEKKNDAKLKVADEREQLQVNLIDRQSNLISKLD